MSNNPPGPWTLSSGVQVLLKVYTGTILLPSQYKTIIDDYVQYNICLMYAPGEGFQMWSRCLFYDEETMSSTELNSYLGRK
jgi:hypothetical protein